MGISQGEGERNDTFAPVTLLRSFSKTSGSFNFTTANMEQSDQSSWIKSDLNLKVDHK